MGGREIVSVLSVISSLNNLTIAFVHLLCVFLLPQCLRLRCIWQSARFPVSDKVEQQHPSQPWWPAASLPDTPEHTALCLCVIANSCVRIIKTVVLGKWYTWRVLKRLLKSRYSQWPWWPLFFSFLSMLPVHKISSCFCRHLGLFYVVPESVMALSKQMEGIKIQIHMLSNC